VKESIFNALHSLGVLEGAVVLDLFAGSGALGIEALSRGARWATFVDAERRSIEALRANLASTDLAERATVVRGDVLAFLRAGAAGGPPGPPTAGQGAGQGHGRGPDVVLADPPYRFDGWPGLLAALALLPASTDPAGVLMVLESDHEVAAPAGWDVVRTRGYGSTVVTFLQFHRADGGDVSGDVAGSADAPRRADASPGNAVRGQEE
jgi:16S rRNA (guanine966-N2)-methyltransferase